MRAATNQGASDRGGISKYSINREIMMSEHRTLQLEELDNVTKAGYFRCNMCKREREEAFRSNGLNRCVWCNGG